MSIDLEEVDSSYNRFLEQLVKTKCLYVGEEETERNVHLDNFIAGEKNISEHISTHFDTETGWDVLLIHDQPFSGSDSIDTIIEASAFVATFTSDASTTATGFTLLWSCFEP